MHVLSLGRNQALPMVIPANCLQSTELQVLQPSSGGKCFIAGSLSLRRTPSCACCETLVSNHLASEKYERGILYLAYLRLARVE